MRNYFICNNCTDSKDIIAVLENLGDRFFSSESLGNELDRLKFNKLIDSVTDCNSAIASSCINDKRSAFELGMLANKFGKTDLISKLWIRGNDSENIYNELGYYLQFSLLKYRCFDVSKLTLKDYIFIGTLYGHSIIVGYGVSDDEFDKMIFTKMFDPNTLLSEFEGKLHNYELDPSSYDSFRKIPHDVMMSVTSI